MKYPWYGVMTTFFDGIFYCPMDGGSFDTLEEAKAKYDSIELEGNYFGAEVYEFYEDRCNILFSKERKLNLPTPETMGRAKYISRSKIRRKETNDNNTL